MKYLLSTGLSTDKVEYYIIDLFKLYLNIWPKDIPNSPDIGFDFILTDVKKDELVNTVRSRVEGLINKIKGKFRNYRTLSIAIESIEIIDQTRIKVTINVNQVKSEEILIDTQQTQY